ncbi:MAG: phosphohydrolase [Rhodanobacter sp. 67-28]|nr:MAG: phosphohydrolase [Rhodanobacter sp. SCN 67-45]OJW42504.1 MAG: phosphohydrolase [Rhodanobacter sp. 67-28]
MVDANTVAMAKAVALRAHAGQIDKAGAPYVGHVARVAARVAGNPLTEAVAWLHDVLEDCPAHAAELHAFPPDVVAAVSLLTRTADVASEMYYERIRQSPVALAVKLADLADNAAPDRLAKLLETVAQRLRAKYEHARAALGQASG